MGCSDETQSRSALRKQSALPGTRLVNKVCLRHAGGLVCTGRPQLGGVNLRYRHIAGIACTRFAEEKCLLEEKAPETGALSSAKPLISMQLKDGPAYTAGQTRTNAIHPRHTELLIGGTVRRSGNGSSSNGVIRSRIRAARDVRDSRWPRQSTMPEPFSDSSAGQGSQRR